MIASDVRSRITALDPGWELLIPEKLEPYDASITAITIHEVRYKREAMQKFQLYEYEQYKVV